MTHELVYNREDSTDVVFKCTTCGTEIGFNKPGVGTPSALPVEGGGWTHPENPDQWMNPCEPTGG